MKIEKIDASKLSVAPGFVPGGGWVDSLGRVRPDDGSGGPGHEERALEFRHNVRAVRHSLAALPMKEAIEFALDLVQFGVNGYEEFAENHPWPGVKKLPWEKGYPSPFHAPRMMITQAEDMLSHGVEHFGPNRGDLYTSPCFEAAKKLCDHATHFGYPQSWAAGATAHAAWWVKGMMWGLIDPEHHWPKKAFASVVGYACDVPGAVWYALWRIKEEGIELKNNEPTFVESRGVRYPLP